MESGSIPTTSLRGRANSGLTSLLATLAAVLLLSTAGRAQSQEVRSTYERYTRRMARMGPADFRSLMDSLGEHGTNSTQGKALIDLLNARWFRQNAQALDAFRILDAMRDDTGLDPYLQYTKVSQLALVYEDLSILDKARSFAGTARDLALSNSLQGEALAMTLLAGEIDLQENNYSAAMAGFAGAYAGSKALEDKTSECRALIGMGKVYSDQGQDSTALVQFLKAHEAAKACGNADLEIRALLNLGVARASTDGPGEAIAFFNSVMDTIGPRTPPAMRAGILSHLAGMYTELGQYDEAMAESDRTLAIYAKLGDTAATALTHLFRANALSGQQRPADALKEVELCLHFAKKMKLRARAMKKAASLLHELGRNEEAFNLMADFITLNDSLAKMKFSEGVQLEQVRFETSEKERRIAELDKSLALATLVSQRKSLQRNLLLLTSAALILLALILWRGLVLRKRLATKERQVHLIEVDTLMHQREIEAINAMLQGQERERTRVGQDLHDRLGSLLGAIKAQVGVLQDDPRNHPQALAHQYIKVNSLVDAAMGETRRISHDLLSATLTRFGLAKALEALCDSVRVTGRLRVELQLFGLERRLDGGTEIVVYRMVQELVSNVLKHANAKELIIALTRQDGVLSIMVTDDGTGFDPEAPQDGIGLQNVRDRAMAIGALVRIDSTPGKGTTVDLECPLTE